MGTRSTIALEFADNTVQMVYCHWDGYLSHNGQILQDNYSNPFKLRELIDLGDLSSLRPEIGIQHAFSSIGWGGTTDEYDRLYGNMCTFYGRDRNEKNTSARKFADVADYEANHQREEYEYILRKDGNWYVSKTYGSGEYVLLSEALIYEAEETA